MFSRHLAIIPLLCAALLASSKLLACPGADREALQWLDRMSHSLRKLSYHGVVTLRQGEELEVMQVWHSVDGSASSGHLARLTGQGGQVSRDDHPLECVHPGQQLLRVGEAMRDGECGLAELYRFSVIESRPVAGRDTVGILVEPRDMYRFGYRLAIDRETGLLLQSETLGNRDKPLENLAFTRVVYEAEQPHAGDAHVLHLAAHPHPRDVSVDFPVQRPWTVTWLPRGFTLTDAPARKSGRRSYTDGLAVFSVFLEDLDRDIRPGEGVVRRGSTTSYTRGRRLSERPVLITVVGEVPVNTARMVADTVRWVQ
ncbi:MAG: MucB/RseB C-terminal domain-containing protein [Halioglobus sp.]|nr:MucB/RseB C-terminal domain-containing protein [Halioglobus sp.]